MDWTNAITLAGVFAGAATAAYVGYSKRWPPAKHEGPLLTSIGVELGNREQTERLIAEVHGIRVAVEILADRRTEEFQDMHKELLDRMDAQERWQTQQKRRATPARRR